MDPEEIIQIKQVGEKIASSVSTFFNDEKNLQTLDAMIELGLEIKILTLLPGQMRSCRLRGSPLLSPAHCRQPRKEVEELVENTGPSVSALSAKTELPYSRRRARLKTRKGKVSRRQDDLLRRTA